MGHAGNPASRARQAGDMAGGFGVIVDRHHDDGRVPARLLDRDESRFGARRKEYVTVLPLEVGGEFGQPFNSALRGTELDHKIAPLSKLELAQPLIKGNIIGLSAPAG